MSLQRTLIDYVNPVTVQRCQSLLSTILGDNKTISSSTGYHLLFFHPVPTKKTTLSNDGYYSYLTPSAILSQPAPYMRRMWGQGSIEFKKPLKNCWIRCQEDLKFIKELKKDYFVSLKRTITDQDGSIFATELRTLMYTNKAVSEDFKTQEEELEPFSNVSIIKVSDIDAMIYSSISSNPHRIHWDRDYCRKVEGYQDLIVQGPLIVQLAIAHVESVFNKSVTGIKYKNTSHLYVGNDVEICVREHKSKGSARVLIRDTIEKGRVYFEATARY